MGPGGEDDSTQLGLSGPQWASLLLKCIILCQLPQRALSQSLNSCGAQCQGQ